MKSMVIGQLKSTIASLSQIESNIESLEQTESDTLDSKACSFQKVSKLTVSCFL